MRIPNQSEEPSLKTTEPENEIAAKSPGRYHLGLSYGRQVYRFRWFIIAFWAIVVLASIPFAAQIGSVLSGGGYAYNSSESAQADSLLHTKLHQPATQLLIIFQSTQTAVSDPRYRQEVNDVMSRARAFRNVTNVTQGGVGQDGRTTYVTVNFNVGAGSVGDQLGAFRALLPNGAAASPARVYLTGAAPLDQDFTQVTLQDTEHAEVFALPLALLVLLVVFGTLVAGAMPILLAVVAIPVTIAVIYFIGLHISMSAFVLDITSIIGLGISIDYSLFMVRRFRDELAAGSSTSEAIGWTVATAGESILYSGLIVIIGFCGLLVIGITIMTSLGIGGAAVVATSVLAALTLLPALLGVLGQRINSLRMPFLNRLGRHTQRNGTNGEARQSFWQRWALGVMKRPVLIILLVMVLLVGLGWPIFSIAIGSTSTASVPKGFESRQGIDLLNAQFPETNQHAMLIVVQTPDGSSMLSSGNLDKLDHLSHWLATHTHNTAVISLTSLPATPGAPALSLPQLVSLYGTGAYQHNPALAQFVAATTNADTTLITVTTHAAVDSSASKALVNDVRAGDTTAAQGLKVFVGGEQADSLDFNNYLYSRFPWTVLFILAGTYILLLLMFRSLLLPLKAILMNVLSVSACLGILVFIFQWGNFSTILDFTSDGFLDSVIPILLFCILFGLSMDYEVFLLSRIREEWLLTQKNRWAVAYGLEKTGGVITNAALLFVIVAGAFVFTSTTVTKEMGLGMAVAILLDASIIRTLLVPATMRLLGRWNWWLPGRPLPQKQAE